MPKSYKLHFLLETVSPLTHMYGVSGNEAVINREVVLYDGLLCNVPVISGNALRHKLIREPGANFIVDVCNLVGKLTINQLNYLYNGGSLVESSVSRNIKKISDMQSMLPLYRLLGGCLRNQIVSGSINVMRGLLMCRENIGRINKLLPEDFKFGDNVHGSSHYISQYQYTRGDSKKMKDIDFFASVDSINEESNKSNLMIFNGQTIVPGSFFYCGFSCQNISDLELGAFFYSLSKWNGFIGGQGSRGHGACILSFLDDQSLNIEGLILDYKEYTFSKRQEIINWLFETFPDKKSKKGEEKNVE
jgi:hypothetical protein